MKNVLDYFPTLKKAAFSCIMLSAVTLLLFTSCTTPEQRLNSALAEVNRSLPQQIAPGMNIEMVSIENGIGTWVIYTILVDDEYYDIVEMDNSKEASKADIIRDLRNGDSDVKKFLRLCKKLKYGIAYKYIGAYSAYSFTIYIGSDKL